MKKQKVLFLCTGNSARSQMAEAFLRHYAADRFEAYSAGLDPRGINPFTEKVMAEAGVDMQGQYSKHLGEYLGKMHFNYVITVCSEADKSCPTVFPGMMQRLKWQFDDPDAFSGSEEMKLERFRETRDRVGEKIRQWLDNPESR